MLEEKYNGAAACSSLAFGHSFAAFVFPMCCAIVTKLKGGFPPERLWQLCWLSYCVLGLLSR
jgi:hypothetical protein